MMNRIASGRRARRTTENSRRPALERLESRALMNADPSPLLVQLRPGTTLDLAPIAAASGAAVEATYVPNLFKLTGSDAALNRVSGGLSNAWQVAYIQPERTFHIDVLPDDPKFTDGSLWGLNGTNGVNAPAAWDVTTGSTTVVVASIDTGVDYRHLDLYKNIWINQAEIPASRKANLVDIDGDGLITFYDLNDAKNQGKGKINDTNKDGRIDGTDLLAAMGKDAGGVDNGTGGWADGLSNDGDQYVDDIIGWDFANNDNNPLDDHGHGTHTSGTMGAMSNNTLGVAGLNWKVQIMPLKFLAANGSGSDDDAAAAELYAAQHGAKVSNNSYGGGDGGDALKDAISTAATYNSIFVCAAGNDGKNTDASANYPSVYPNDSLVAVAAIGSDGKLASFSNFGATTVDIGAPGVGIVSTIRLNNYGTSSGTSMASPHVAGVVALVWSLHPNWTYTQVINQVLSTARPSAAMAGRSVTGGVLDAAAAVLPPAVPNSASFKGLDTTAKGDWATVAGNDGHVIVSDTTSLPPYATVTASGQGTNTWSSNTTDVRALRRASGTGRVAAAWYATTTFTVDVNLSDGKVHPVALHAIDWDRKGRSERIDVIDADSNAVLDSQTVSGFSDGVYLKWDLKGHLKFKVTRLGSASPVLSGLFIGGPVGQTPPPADGTTVSFQGTDTSTKGDWSPTYGPDGEIIVNDSTAPPSYATVTPAGQASYTYSSTTTDPRALRRASGTGRIASTWYSGSSFTIDVNFTDGAAHSVTLYSLDWDRKGRSQRIDVIDQVSGATLDSQTLSSFTDGAYMKWNIKGHVKFKISTLTGPSAVVSGVFFGPTF